MSGRADYQLRDYMVWATLADVSAASSAYIPVPFDGEIVETVCVLSTAITVADSVVTLSVIPAGVVANAVAVGTTLTVPFTGSGAGSTSRAVHSGARTCRVGDSIRVTTGGESTTTSVATFGIKIRR